MIRAYINATTKAVTRAVLPLEIVRPPLIEDALFWLDGSIITVGEDKYFRDRLWTRNFLITGYDFESTWTKGMPYKTAATISAPAADAALIAADINNYLYASDGTPNQIPVVSLFQDIDYEHKLFCRHRNQVVNGFGVETYEPRVIDIVLYNTVKSGADLTTCQEYFVVPVEDTTTSAWLSPSGNDSTGTGTKTAPYRSLAKIKDTTKATVYLKSGTYDMGERLSFTGTPLTVVGVGYSRFAMYPDTIGAYFTRPMHIRHCVITSALNTYGVYISAKTTFENCSVSKSDGAVFALMNNVLSELIFKNSLLNITNDSLKVNYNVNVTNLELIGCYGQVCLADTGNVWRRQASATIKYNKLINSYIEIALATNSDIRFNNISAPEEKNPCLFVAGVDENLTGIKFEYNTIIGKKSSSYFVYFSAGGESGQNGIIGLSFKYNRIINTYVGVGSTHTVFIGGTIDPIIKYNEITFTCGYGIVIKSGGIHYTTTTPHVVYNVFKCTGQSDFTIIGRGVYGLIVANNTIIGFHNNVAFMIDDDGKSYDNSMLCVNNLITLGGNTTKLADGVNMTSRNNAINKMGFVLTNAIGEDDYEITETIDDRGIPSAKIEHAEATTENYGLSSSYSIPESVTHQSQSDIWQNGAVILS